MKKIITGLAALSLIASFAFISTVDAAAPSTAPGQNKLQCFSGSQDTIDNEGYGPYTGTCTLKGNGARGPATLNTVDNDTDPYNNYAGVYVQNSDVYGQPLSSVKKLSFNFTGEATAGAPRFSVPIDTDGNGSTNFWAYVSAYYCNDGMGTVDAINDSTCTVYTSTNMSYPNWAAFVAAYPGAKVANDYALFIIADEPGMWTVSGVKFGK